MIFAVLPATSLLAGCGSLGSGEADRLLRERLGPGEPVYFSTYVPYYDGTEPIADLVRLGLIEFVEGDFRKNRRARAIVTAEGTRLGLELKDDEQLRGKLCDVVFGSITQLGKPTGDSVAVVQADFVLRHAAPTPLLDRVHGTKVVDAAACDSAKTFPQQGQFVRTAGAWRLNNAPVFPDSGISTRVTYQYDRFGDRTGAVNEMTILAPADADGDSVSVSWTGREFNGTSLEPMAKLEPAGLKASFPGMRGAVVYAVARDRFGGVDSARFCFQTSRFTC